MKKSVATALLLTFTATAGHSETVDVQTALQQYGAAWASRDVERIVALHTEDSEFRLFVDGTPVAKGRSEIALQFGAILQSNPTYQSAIETAWFGSNFVVLEYRIRMDADTAVELGARTFAATGSHYDVDAIDVIEFEDGLVSRKHTFVDAEALHNASPSVSLRASENPDG